jgi:hypothetical protein
MLFNKIITLYSAHHMKPLNHKSKQHCVVSVKGGDTYSYFVLQMVVLTECYVLPVFIDL